MTAPRFHSSTDPMAQRGPIQGMDSHDLWLAGMAPRRAWGRWIVNLTLFVMGFVGAFVWAVGG